MSNSNGGDTDSIRVGILTVSDRCSQGKAEDVSGRILMQAIEDSQSNINWKVAEKNCIPDNRTTISTVLMEWCDSARLDLILTTGGTGFSERDVTPEATRDILDKETTAITFALTKESLNKTCMAMLSRLVSGIRKRTLIINFPGSPKACTQCIDVVKPVIKHAIDHLRGSDEVNELHNEMMKLKSKEREKMLLHYLQHCSESGGRTVVGGWKPLEFKSAIKNHAAFWEKDRIIYHLNKVDISQVARRNRKSPYNIITVEEAQSKILSCDFKLIPVIKNIRHAVGFVVAEDIIAKEPFPPFRASIKDGYAVVTADGAGPRRVISSSLAGFDSSSNISVKPGECMRVTTGAPLPEGSDAVVQVEDTLLVSENDHGKTELVIEILKPPKMGQDIREIGSDIREGEKLVGHGTTLTPGALGVLATAGHFEIPVFKKPKVAVLSTGNELQPPEEILKPGSIRDSNKTALLTLLEEKGFSVHDSGIAVDDSNVLLNVIHNALQKCDVLITTGGVSMGERDLLADVLIEDFKAEMIFGRLKMKPGKPTKFFRVPTKDGPKYVFGLPGNPVSAIVCCHLLVFPALRAMSGWPRPLPMLFRVKISIDLKLDERFEFARAFLKWNKGEDIPSAVLTGNQISSRLMNMVEAECLLHIPAATPSMKVLPAGSIVNAELINQNLTRTTDITQ